MLKDFAKADQEWLDKMLEAVAANLPVLLAGDENGFMNKVTLATRPPPPPKPPRVAKTPTDI